jgi:hypothetical protein
MKVPSTVAVVIAAALVSACGSASTSSPSAGSPSTASTSASASAGSMSCTDFDLTAAHLMTYVHYVSLNVGTDNASSGYFAEMKDAVSALDANAAQCAPKASSAMAALRAATSALELAYKPGTDAATISADKAALAAYLVAAKSAWTAMGKDAQVWDTELRYSV